MGGLIGAFNPLPDFLNFSNFRYHIFYQSCHISQRGFPGLTYHNFGYHWWSCLGIWPPPTLFFFSLFGIYFFYLPQPTDSDFTNGHWRSFWAFCTCFIRSYVAQLLYPPVVSHITPRCLSQECEEDDINCVTWKSYRVTHLNISAKWSQIFTKCSANVKIGLLSWLIMCVGTYICACTPCV